MIALRVNCDHATLTNRSTTEDQLTEWNPNSTAPLPQLDRRSFQSFPYPTGKHGPIHTPQYQARACFRSFDSLIRSRRGAGPPPIAENVAP